MHECATTFEEHIQIVSTEDPHAVILGWWRKLSLALEDYFQGLDECRGSAYEVGRRIASDLKLGPEVAARLRALRFMRNAVAHEDVGPLSCEEAIRYAEDAFRLMWVLIRAAD